MKIKEVLKKSLYLYSLKEVFTPNTVAKATYVKRDNLEKNFIRDLEQPGRAIILYGHTGSGKTTLVRNVIRNKNNFVQISCGRDTTFNDILCGIIDQLSLFYISSQKTTVKYSLSKSIKSDFKKVAAELKSNKELGIEESAKRMVDPQITPQKIAQFLGEMNAILILEDFHKVKDEEKTKLADCIKIFVDAANDYPETKVICIGAVDSPREMIEQGADLYPRVSEIQVPMLSDEELKSLIIKGCHVLNIEMSERLINKIVFYSNNIASLAHGMCYDICFYNNISRRKLRKTRINDDNFKYAVDAFINRNSDSLKKIYDLNTRNRLGWHILKALLNGNDSMSIDAIVAKIPQNKYQKKDVEKKLQDLASEEIRIIRYDKILQSYAISTPFWGAFLKMKFQLEEEQEMKNQQNKNNHDLKILDATEFDSMVLRSFKELLDKLEKYSL